MSNYAVSTEIGVPPQVVFPFLVEPDRLSSWMPGFLSSEPLTKGPPAVGTRSIDVFTEGGREIRMTTEITAFEPPGHLAVAITTPMGEVLSDYRLEGTERTRITHRQTLRFGGVYRLMAPFIGGTMRRRLETDLAALKKAVEGTTP